VTGELRRGAAKTRRKNAEKNFEKKADAWVAARRRHRRFERGAAEDSASGAASGEAAALKRIAHHYANPSLTPHVSASSALEPGEQEPPDSLILSASFSASLRLRVEMKLEPFAPISRVPVLYRESC
jgi:hypothetical protein